MEDFGDPRLVNSENRPVSADERPLRGPQIVALWGALACVPGLYGFVVAEARLPPIGSLAALGVGAALSIALGWLLAESGRRFGIGFPVLCRVAYGTRGANLVVLLRWLLGAAWLGAWALELGGWLRRLLIVDLEAVAPSEVAAALAYHLPPPLAVSPVSWALGAGLVWLAALVARGKGRRISRVAWPALLFALIGTLGIAVFGFVRTDTLGVWQVEDRALSAADLVAAASRAAWLLLPATIASADWVRYQHKEVGRMVWAPGLVAGFVLLFAAAGVVDAGAARAVLGAADGVLIADAARFGHPWASHAAALVAVAGWLAAAPLVGLYCSNMALNELRPRLLRYRGGLWGTAAVAAVAMPFLALVPAPVSAFAASVLVAPLGVLLCDLLIVRRRKLVLEDAYLRVSPYGPTAGFRVSALVATALGWVVHPEVLQRLAAALPPLQGLHHEAGAWDATRPWLSGLVAGAAFVVLQFIERFLVFLTRSGFVAVKKAIVTRLKNNREIRWIGPESSKVTETTNPYFEYRKGGRLESRQEPNELSTDPGVPDTNEPQP